jgi:hypothetical protein
VLRSLASLSCIVFLFYSLLKGEITRKNGPNLLMADLVGGSVGMYSVAWQARLGSVLADRMELWLALHCMVGRAGWSTSRPGRPECWQAGPAGAFMYAPSVADWTGHAKVVLRLY